MSVKCRYCGKLLEKNQAKYVERGNTKIYYCPHHLGMVSDESKFYKELSDLFVYPVSRGLLVTQFKEVAAQYGYPALLAYLDKNRKYFNSLMQTKNFVSGYAAVRYILAVFRNQMPYFKMPKVSKEIKKVESRDDYRQKYPKKVQKRSLEDILDAL